MVKVGLDKMPRESIEQLGVGRRIGGSQIVLGLDEASPQKMLPVAIDKNTSEETVVFAGHPVDESDSRVGLFVD